VTYGTVRAARRSGLHPGHARSSAKDKGEEPFDAPAPLLAAIKAKTWGPYADPTLGEVPVDFLSDVDTTGGNSGSPTLNARGELIGLLFDGTAESVSSDVVFDPVDDPLDPPGPPLCAVGDGRDRWRRSPADRDGRDAEPVGWRWGGGAIGEDGNRAGVAVSIGGASQ
jgi:hypothetical protein